MDRIAHSASSGRRAAHWLRSCLHSLRPLGDHRRFRCVAASDNAGHRADHLCRHRLPLRNSAVDQRDSPVVRRANAGRGRSAISGDASKRCRSRNIGHDNIGIDSPHHRKTSCRKTGRSQHGPGHRPALADASGHYSVCHGVAHVPLRCFQPKGHRSAEAVDNGRILGRNDDANFKSNSRRCDS